MEEVWRGWETIGEMVQVAKFWRCYFKFDENWSGQDENEIRKTL